MNSKLEPAEVLLKRLDEATEKAAKDFQRKIAIIQAKDEKIKELESDLENYTITYPCTHCGEESIIYANSSMVEDIRAYLKIEGWGHAECIEEEKKEREKKQARLMRYGALLSRK